MEQTSTQVRSRHQIDGIDPLKLKISGLPSTRTRLERSRGPPMISMWMSTTQRLIFSCPKDISNVLCMPCLPLTVTVSSLYMHNSAEMARNSDLVRSATTFFQKKKTQRHNIGQGYITRAIIGSAQRSPADDWTRIMLAASCMVFVAVACCCSAERSTNSTLHMYVADEVRC